MDFFNKLELVSNRLTKTEKKIAEYIRNHPDQVLYQSITDLSGSIGVSETSTFRFCKTVGFEGYQELKMNLAKSLSISNNINVMESQQKITQEDDIRSQVQKLLSSSIASLNQTVDMLDEAQLQAAVTHLTRARAVGFFGTGSSNLSAQEARRVFSRVRGNVIHTTDLHDQLILASSMDEKDFAIVLSYSGATRDTLEIMKLLHERQVPILLITRYEVSSATKYADFILLCGTNNLFTGDSLSNRISQMFITNVLYTNYYMKNYDDAKEMKLKSLDALSHRIFYDN